MFFIQQAPPAHPRGHVLSSKQVMVSPYKFKIQLPPPVYTSAAAKKVVKSMLKAEANLRPVAIHVVGDDGNVLIYWNHGRIRQEAASSVWVYSNRRLTESCDKGFYQGHASRADVLDYVAFLSGGVDTLSRELMYKMPFSDFVQPGTKISLGGTISLDGQSSDIVQISGRQFKGALYVRRSDFLVIGVDIDSLEGTGTALEHGHRRYAYKSLPADSKSLFALTARRGVAVKALPKSALVLQAPGFPSKG